MCYSGFETVSVIGWYTDMLQNRIIPSLADKHLLESSTYMRDGAPSHVARQVKDLLRTTFRDDRVLHQHFRYVWPSRSPDLNPCNFWFLGYLKWQIYRDRPISIGMLNKNN